MTQDLLEQFLVIFSLYILGEKIPSFVFSLLCGFRITGLLHFPVSAKGDLYTVLLKRKNGYKHPQSTFIFTVSFQIKFRAKTAKTYDYSNTPLYSG